MDIKKNTRTRTKYSERETPHRRTLLKGKQNASSEW